MRSVSFLLLCLAVLLFADVTHQSVGQSACLCLKTSNTVLRKEHVSDYRRQTAGVCHINAIVFKSVKGSIVCADPQKRWVREAMTYVDSKKKTDK